MPNTKKGDSRLTLNEDLPELMSKMSDGNPGALTVLVLIFNKAREIDPDAFMGPYAHILNLDSYGIYGSHIWIMYKYICNEDIIKTIAVIRSVQLNILPISKLIKAIKNIEEHQHDKPVGFEVQELLIQVKKELPNFSKG